MTIISHDAYMVFTIRKNSLTHWLRQYSSIRPRAGFFLPHCLFQPLSRPERGNPCRWNGHGLAGFGVTAWALGAGFDFKGAEADEGNHIPCRQSLSHGLGEGVDNESGLGLRDVGFLADGADEFGFVHGAPHARRIS
ncbi:hypothetical protein [Sodalis phage phiSG1]|uniref:hypothetical protein n=1 Tax=Sodalis phage phiSG1 TaxID=373126 RepID=UPI00006C5BEC|nr:hypothetical protein SGPHI_0003 [Sodalis phage phiSG1]BAE80466.1 hypothetical protein [Sodalis phage phiSG1]